MKQIKAYKCDFCSKLYQREHAVNYHELICNKNPENKRPCFGCEFLDKKRTYASKDCPDGEVPVDVFYCESRKIFLHMPQSEIKGNLLDVDSEIMPKECDSFSENSFVIPLDL